MKISATINRRRNEKMSKYFDKTKLSHIKLLKPVHKRVGLKKPKQLQLFPNYVNYAHVWMGLYFELLTSAIFGGALVDSIIPMESDNGYNGCKPDVKSVRQKKIFESKAMRQGHQINFLDDQINRYISLQILNPDYQIYFVIWRHGIKNIKAYSGNELDLKRQLSKKTYACVVLPLSLINRMHTSYKFKRYELKTEQGVQIWPSCTRIGSATINNIFFDPNKMMEEANINPSLYKWDFYVSSRVTIDGFENMPIPITYIKDRNNKWIESLIQDVPF
jgi:hypothetical protein